MRVAICDDEPIYVERLSQLTQNICESLEEECQISTFYSGEEILADVEHTEYDLVLLDIYMPGVDGFQVARDIFETTHGDNIVFVSNEEQLVFQTLKFRPFGFVRKYILEEELKKVIHRWYKYYRNNFKLLVKSKDGEEKYIKAKKVMYIEQKLHYLYIHTKEETYKERAKLSKYEYLLADRIFVKCNMSYICNMQYVMTFKQSRMNLVNNVSISVSRKLLEQAREKYDAYIYSEYIED